MAINAREDTDREREEPGWLKVSLLQLTYKSKQACTLRPADTVEYENDWCTGAFCSYFYNDTLYQ